MDHAQTIAMATDLLADGRAEDVVQMVDPLLEPVEAPAASTGQLLLRGLRARIEVVHRDRPARALEYLPSPSAVQDLCACVRAEVGLWRGWVHARRSSRPAVAIRALGLLEDADDLFGSIHDPRGRCWARLGRARALFSLGEYALMRRTLDDAEPLVGRLDEDGTQRWFHDLSIPARQFDGQYDAAESHLQSLRSLGRSQHDRRLRGRASAHEAALRYALGHAPAEIIDSAQTAEALLRSADAGYPLQAAYHAHVAALLRRGDGRAAEAMLDEAESAVRDEPADQLPFRVLRARMALRRDEEDGAAAHLETLTEQAEDLPHGVHGAPIALLRGEVRAHQNRLDDAYTWMQRAHRCARETGRRDLQLRSRFMMARTDAARGNPDAARAHLDAAEAHSDALSALPLILRRFSAEGAVAQAADRPDEATAAYRLALAAASMIHDRYRTAALQLALAQLERRDRAHALASAARETFDALGADDEATVAASLADDTPASPESPSPSPHPASALEDVELATTLRRASLSVSLVAHTWLEAAAAQVPCRWLGVYRLSSDGIAVPLHEHGRRPEGLSPPSGPVETSREGPAHWQFLSDARPTLCLGVAVDPDDGRTTRSRLDRIRPLIRLAWERARLLQDRSTEEDSLSPWTEVPVEGFVAESDAMQAVLDRLRRLRKSRSPLLLVGESGAGKRLLGRVLHAVGPRADGPLHHLACASMQREPLSERLFGHVSPDGSLTPGAVHEAEGGTLLIEDVDALPAPAQNTLVRLLDTGAVPPTDGTTATPVDLRLIATIDGTSADGMEPSLRERLSTLTLGMPPLRERRADIPLLVRHFLDTLRSDTLKDAAEAPVTPPAMEALLRYDWPGNVRQLRNELERALVHVASEPVQTIDCTVLLDQIVDAAQSAESAPPVDAPDAILHPEQTLSDVLSQTEAAVIRRVLRACDGQITASAEVLGLSRQGLYKKMKRLGIDASEIQPDPNPATTT